MPTVEVDPDELRRLTRQEEKPTDELKADLFKLGLEFEGVTEDDEFQLEFAPDRLDRLSVEGVARSLRYHYGQARGVYIPKTPKSDWTIHVDEDVPPGRNKITGAVVRGITLGGGALESLIKLQEKLHETMGRSRAKGAIGIHDLSMLKGRSALDDNTPSITYTGIEPAGDRFVPLDSDEEMTPADVLTDHPVGERYGDLVSSFDRYPAIYDDIGLFSFPPIINGRRTEVTPDSRDLFIEMTGTDQWTIDHMLNIVCYALNARGGNIETIDVQYADETIVRPDFSVEEFRVPHRRIERVLGIDLEYDSVIDLGERAGLRVDTQEIGDDEVEYVVGIPPYRVDVLHPLDVIDDLGRAYGFNELTPRYPDVSTVGQRHQRSRLERSVRDVLGGLGFEDLLDFHLISEDANFSRMQLTPSDKCVGGGEPVRITEPYSAEYEIFRTWALPSLMMVLENNTHRAYPQDLSEIGHAMCMDHSANTQVCEWRTVAGVLARTDASYEDVKGCLQVVAQRFDVSLETPATTHPAFIAGRVADVIFDGEVAGVLGEIHPAVIVEHDLELPVAGFEFSLDALDTDS